MLHIIMLRNTKLHFLCRRHIMEVINNNIGIYDAEVFSARLYHWTQFFEF
jgi:hypothetical protein